MKKITEFYLNKATYKAIDEEGSAIDITVDYWSGTFDVSPKNIDLEKYAQKLLSKKHRINFVHKMKE